MRKFTLIGLAFIIIVLYVPITAFATIATQNQDIAMIITMLIAIMILVIADSIAENHKYIKIKYHSDDVHLESIEQGDLIDLKSAEDVVLKAGEYKSINLGVSMQLPDGYMAKVYPRSSTFKNFGIIMVNSVGIIDESFCGDDDVWGFPAYAVRDTEIHRGDRIAQFEIVEKQPSLYFREVSVLGNANRGGVGSTGIK